MTGQVTTDIRSIGKSKIATLTIDNTTRLNSLNSGLIADLTAQLDAVETESDLACLILTGAGKKAFIGGADITEMVDLTPASARQFITNLHMLCRKIRLFPVPVIARINGYCLGAGMEVAACCDISVAVDAAQFAMPEVHVGIPSVIDAALLPQIIGVGLARELVLTGRTLSAEEAKTSGLVQYVVAQSELDSRVDEVAASLRAAGPIAIALQKQLCNIWENESLEHSIEKGIEAFCKAYESGEPKQMMSSFINRKR